jgi:hypothetical protein
MTALARRIANLEMRSAPREAYHVLSPEDGETYEEAWWREHPNAAFPAIPLVIAPVGPGHDCSDEAWQAWCLGDDRC